MANLKPKEQKNIYKTLTFMGDLRKIDVIREDLKFCVVQNFSDGSFADLNNTIYLDENDIDFLIDALKEVREDYKVECHGRG